MPEPMSAQPSEPAGHRGRARWALLIALLTLAVLLVAGAIALERHWCWACG